MTDSKDEMEIVSTYFENEEAANFLSSMREHDKKAGEIGKAIILMKKELYDLQTKCGNTNSNDQKICDKKKQLAEMVEEYKFTINEVLKLAKLINFEVENLEYQKIDIDVMPKKNNIYYGVEENEEDQPDPVIILNNNTNIPNIFVCDDNNNETKFNINNKYTSMCSCNENSEKDSDCDENHSTKNIRCNMPCASTENDYEKEMIRDDLMSIKGEIKLLHQQNRDLLCKLNNSNERKIVLSNAIRNKSDFVKCKEQPVTCTQCPEDMDMSKTKMLICEIDRLRDELKVVKRDRCQIELARKILNVSDTQCANCVGSNNPETMTQLKEMTEQYKRILIDQENKKNEIIDLRKLLEKARHDAKNFEDCLIISKAQIVQLEKQLFDFSSAKSHDPEVASSNDKYLIESLRHSLHLANEEKTNMQMVLDFHLTELEDKKLKYLAVLQTKQEQKHRIETLCKEKNTIAKEYEAEFNRMNEHLQKRLEEIEKLPCMLATAQKDLENEKSTRIALENELQFRLEQIHNLNVALANAENKINWHDNDEEEKIQLRATIKTLNDTLAENERLYLERTHYSLQLKDHLDALREEAAIQVTKTKDFSECQRIKYTEYIQKLEHQLAECRAMACSEFKKRDHVDERLRDHIKILTNNLNEAHKQIGELFNARNLIETKMVNNLCKIPRTLKSSCKVLNNPTTENE